MSNIVNFTPSTAALTAPTGSNTVELFSTYSVGTRRWFALSCLSRLIVAIKNNQTGTIHLYSSRTGSQSDEIEVHRESVAIPATGESNKYDFLVGDYDHFRVTWENGGTNQTVWDLYLAGASEASPLS